MTYVKNVLDLDDGRPTAVLIQTEHAQWRPE